DLNCSRNVVLLKCFFQARIHPHHLWMLLYHFFGWPKSADACRDRDQRIDHLRMLKRKIDSQSASSRDAHQIGALDAQEFHQVVEILAISIRLTFRNQPRIAKASLIVAYDTVSM